MYLIGKQDAIPEQIRETRRVSPTYLEPQEYVEQWPILHNSGLFIYLSIYTYIYRYVLIYIYTMYIHIVYTYIYRERERDLGLQVATLSARS